MKNRIVKVNFLACFLMAGCMSSHNPSAVEDAGGVASPAFSLDADAGQKVQAVASSCRQEVNGLWALRGQLSLDKMREFQITIGQSSAHCDRLQHFLTHLQIASGELKGFQSSIARVKSLASDTEFHQGTEPQNYKSPSLTDTPAIQTQREELPSSKPSLSPSEGLYDIQ